MPKSTGELESRYEEPKRSPVGRRLIVAFVLIGLAIGGLMVADQLRHRPAVLVPSHEPSQALITSPLQSEPVAPLSTQFIDPSLPGQTAATEAPASAPRDLRTSDSPEQTSTSTRRPAGPAYFVQVGVFNSPANAQALQKQLQQAGIESRLETRVHLGPFHDRREAHKALIRAKKLGVEAVLVGAR
ncbi:MAG: SPOR domain-containing protein [Gallionella sp.]